MYTYKLEVRKVDRGGPDFSVIVRRSESTIAIGVGCGYTLAEAIKSACAEVRYRRVAGEFREGNTGAAWRGHRKQIEVFHAGTWITATLVRTADDGSVQYRLCDDGPNDPRRYVSRSGWRTQNEG